MAYDRRLLDDALDQLFPHLAAIAIEGAKGVGKTASARQRAANVLSLNDPREQVLLDADPDLITRTQAPLFIDEWQLRPWVWDAVRRAVDADATGGQFLLAGSAGLEPGVTVHSGAGRIVRLHMRPLAMSERAIADPTVSLTSLFAPRTVEIQGETAFALPDYAHEILASGFPGIRPLPNHAREVQLDSYIDRIIDHELPENGVNIRRPRTLRAWLAAYGAATATDARYSTLLDAATAGQKDKPARQTVDMYRDHLQRLFILDPLEAWIPTFNPLKRLTLSAKHHLVDPALAARLIGLSMDALMSASGPGDQSSTRTWLGALFESLVVQSVRVYAEANRASVGHLRTMNGEREIDVIVEGADRRVVAMEVKLKATVEESDGRHLNWLQRELGDRLADRVLITTGKYAYRRKDGIAVIPLALLGP